MTISDIEIHMIRSGKGDCIHLRFIGSSGNPCNIVVDTGPTSTSGEFRKLYEGIIQKDCHIDILIITHYDDDHIGGILKLAISDPTLKIRKAVFNAYCGEKLSPFFSASQNQRLFHTLINTDIEYKGAIKGDVFDLDGAKITVIAPTEGRLLAARNEMQKEDEGFFSAVSDWSNSIENLMDAPYSTPDTSVANRASIAFVLEYNGFRLLFCGDAPAESIMDGLHNERSHFDLVKLPHHGSCRNISDGMLGLIKTESFLVCADGKSHPNKQTIAKLMKTFGNITVYSNYDWWREGFFIPEDEEFKKNLTFVLAG